MNTIYLIGNIGKDPEIRTLDNGKKVITFSVATTDKDKDQKETTIWHNVKGWNWIADLPLNKGIEVFITGKMVNESYDKKDGTKGYSSYVLAQTVKVAQRFTKMTDQQENHYDAGSKFGQPTPLNEEGLELPF